MNADTAWMFSFGLVVLKFTSVQRVIHTGWRLQIISIVLVLLIVNNAKTLLKFALIIYRMDKDQFMRRQAYAMANYENMQEIEYYEFEGKTFFALFANQAMYVCIFV